MSSDDKPEERRFVSFSADAMFMYQSEEGDFNAIGVSQLVDGIVNDFMETDMDSIKSGIKVSGGAGSKAINTLRDKLAEQGYPEVEVTTYRQGGHRWVKFKK